MIPNIHPIIPVFLCFCAFLGVYFALQRYEARTTLKRVKRAQNEYYLDKFIQHHKIE